MASIQFCSEPQGARPAALFHGTAAVRPTLFAVRRITLIIALARMMVQTITRMIPMVLLMGIHRQEANSALERPCLTWPRLQFERDSGGKVTGFKLTTGRVRNLRFDRQLP